MSDTGKSWIDRLYECIEAGGFDGLTDAEKSMFGLYWLFAEANNGGVHQFFFNDSGSLAGEALRGLEMVGAVETADILRRAVAAFPNGRVPADQQERRSLMEELDGGDDALTERLGELTAELYACREDVAELLDAYRKAHPEQFPCLKRG